MIREPVNKILEEYRTKMVFAMIISIIVAATVEFIFQVEATNILANILLIPIGLYLIESILIGSFKIKAKAITTIVQAIVVVIPIFLVKEYYTINSPVGSLLFISIMIIGFLFIINTQKKIQNLIENILSRIVEPHQV